MEHEIGVVEKEEWSFLKDQEAVALFGKLDYSLKDGIHIQEQYAPQSGLFRFVSKHYNNLKAYYQKFYGVNLERGGEGHNLYYFIEFSPQSRGEVPANHRYFMQPEFVIIGFLLYKIVYIDLNIELRSVSRFQKIVRQEHEDLKPSIYYVLEKVQKEKHNPMDDDKVDKIIVDALEEFDKIGWISLQKEHDRFEVLPSFQRLVKIYSDYINDPDSWLKQN